MDAQLKQEIRFLTTRLGEMVREQAGDKVFHQVESIRKLAKAIRAHRNCDDLRAARKLVRGFSIEQARLVGHAFSLFFQITNLCEERARLRHLQIHFLDRWRRTPAPRRTEQMRRLLALTVNGIAFGMKSTG